MVIANVTHASAMKDGLATIVLVKVNEKDAREIQTKKFVPTMGTVYAINAYVIKLKDFQGNSAKNIR